MANDWNRKVIEEFRANKGRRWGTESFEVNALVAEGEERNCLFVEQKRRYPRFGEYEAKTTRRIPVVILERIG